MMYRLIILTGPSTGLRVTIESKPMVIGRDPDCAIRVADEEVAKKHAVIEHKPDGIHIQDLGSMNRILVNHHEVREARLKHGDMIELGLTRFLVQALVQADVTDEKHMEKRARKVALASVAATFLVLMVVAASVWILIQKGDQIVDLAPVEIAPLEPVETTVNVVTTAPVVAVAAETGKQETNGLRESLQPVSDELRLVREDLADLRATMKTLSVQPAPPPPVPLQPEKRKPARAPSSDLQMIKIASVDQQKFPASDEFDEMRMLNIGLTSDVPPEEIDPSAVHVEVSFFDEGPSNQVSLTQVIAPKEPLTPDGTWGQEEQKIVTATYMVPTGFRKSETGGAKKYYGYRIRVFYHDKLQDADARPKNLLDSMNSGGGTTNNQPKQGTAGTGAL